VRSDAEVCEVEIRNCFLSGRIPRSTQKYVHGLYILMEDILAVTMLEGYGDLICNVDYLGFSESLSMHIST
jgi:hypothetical protein